MAGINIKVNMTKERDTKNTVRYKADADEAPVDTLYIQKSGLGENAPEKIQVVVTTRS